MSPLVQRSRSGAAPRPNPADQHWSMLLFESLSAGVMAIGVGLAAVMLVVSFVLLLVINWLQAWNAKRSGRSV